MAGAPSGPATHPPTHPRTQLLPDLLSRALLLFLFTLARLHHALEAQLLLLARRQGQLLARPACVMGEGEESKGNSPVVQ